MWFEKWPVCRENGVFLFTLSEPRSEANAEDEERCWHTLCGVFGVSTYVCLKPSFISRSGISAILPESFGSLTLGNSSCTILMTSRWKPFSDRGTFLTDRKRWRSEKAKAGNCSAWSSYGRSSAILNIFWKKCYSQFSVLFSRWTLLAPEIASVI